jgi:hypothetical protein
MSSVESPCAWIAVLWLLKENAPSLRQIFSRAPSEPTKTS